MRSEARSAPFRENSVTARTITGTASKANWRNVGGRRRGRGAAGAAATGLGIHGGEKTVSPAGQRFDEPGRLGGVAQSRPESLHGGIQAGVEIDEGVLGPKPLLEFFPRDQFAGTRQQHGQDFDGLALQPDFDPLLSEFSGALVKLEKSEPGWPAHFHSCYTVRTGITYRRRV